MNGRQTCRIKKFEINNEQNLTQIRKKNTKT